MGDRKWTFDAEEQILQITETYELGHEIFNKKNITVS